MARQLGCTPRELEARVDSRDLSEWLAYERIEPGPEIYLHALLSAAAAHASAFSKQPLGAADFLPPRPRPPSDRPRARREQTSAEGVARILAAFPGAKVIRPDARPDPVPGPGPQGPRPQAQGT